MNGLDVPSLLTQSGCIEWNSLADSWSSLKQQDPTDGPITAKIFSVLLPNRDTMAFTVAIAIPMSVPFQPLWSKKIPEIINNTGLY